MDEPLPGPVENVFGGARAPAADDAFRQALLQRTIRVVRCRRRRRRVLNAAALAVCFLAGAACMRWWWQAPAEQVPVANVKDQPPAPSVPAPRKADPLAAAFAAEWHAFDERSGNQDLYRQAGDLYVEQNQDYESALRCYTQALDAGPGQDLTISPDDNWLLMALKDARQKEKNDARTGD